MFPEMVLSSVTIVVLFALRAFFKRFGIRSRSHDLLASLLASIARHDAPAPARHDGLDEVPLRTPQDTALYADTRSFVEV